MNLDFLREKLIEALKNKDDFSAGVLRLLLAAVNNKLIELRGRNQALTAEAIEEVLRKEAKKRKESIEAYRAAGRLELASGEEKELAFIESLLPPPLKEEEIEQIVKEIIKTSPSRDFGTIMKAVMAKVQNRADGSAVASIVKKYL